MSSIPSTTRAIGPVITDEAFGDFKKEMKDAILGMMEQLEDMKTSMDAKLDAQETNTKEAMAQRMYGGRGTPADRASGEAGSRPAFGIRHTRSDYDGCTQRRPRLL